MEIFFLSSFSTKVDFLLLFEDKWWKEVFFIDKIILLSAKCAQKLSGYHK